MKLGINSRSLAVKDIQASKTFYENLGFNGVPDGGSVEEKWLFMQKKQRSDCSKICFRTIS